MPPMTALRVSVLDDLARQLRFIPAATARRHLARAEALLPEIDPERNYPEDWIGWKITGYRTEPDEPAIVAGAALLGDLPALIERLSTAAQLRPEDHAGWLTTADLGARWGVTRRTLERYRRLGLAGRRVRRADQRWVVLYDPAHLAWFTAREGTRLAHEHPTRMTAAERSRLRRRAARYHARLGWTRQRIAERLAQRSGRSVEAVRRVLARGGEGVSPAVAARRRLRGTAAQALARAALRGEGDADGRDRTRRVTLRQTAAALRELLLASPGPDAAGHAARFGAAAVSAAQRAPWLEPASVCGGLGGPVAATLADLLADTAARGWPDATIERERATAAWFLRFRAAAGLRTLAVRAPSAAALDAVLTDLRHEARLRVELVRSEQRATLEAIRGYLGRPVDELPGAAAAALLDACFDALIDAVERYDPFGRGRLASPAGLAVNKALARWAAGRPREPIGRAVAVSDPGAVALVDWSRRVVAWTEWIDPPAHVRAHSGRLDELAGRVLARRLGWDGRAPATINATAAELGLTTVRVRRIERAALERAGTMARDATRAGDAARGRA